MGGRPGGSRLLTTVDLWTALVMAVAIADGATGIDRDVPVGVSMLATVLAAVVPVACLATATWFALQARRPARAFSLFLSLLSRQNTPTALCLTRNVRRPLQMCFRDSP